MTDIRARTCSDHFAGTSDDVRIHFRNGNNETCATRWLTEGGGATYRGPWLQKWPADHLKAWTEQLGSCGRFRLQPTDGGNDGDEIRDQLF